MKSEHLLYHSANFVNDACGAPIPWQQTLTWTFFDGKLFHLKLRKASRMVPLLEVCDGRMNQVGNLAIRMSEIVIYAILFVEH